MSTSRYQSSLDPKVLRRARIVLGSLLTSVVILTVAGIYYGVQSGGFNQTFVKPFQQFAADWEKFAQQTPLPTPEPLVIPTPLTTKSTSTSTSTTKVIINQTTPVVSNCIRKNIREGEFASNKCYLQQDYDDLQYYLGRYNNANFDRNSTISFMEITCNGRSEMFRQDCEKQKARKAEAEASMDKYRGIIQGIIAKGK